MTRYSTTASRAVLLTLGACMSLFLAGCGRKGALEAPAGAAPAKAPSQERFDPSRRMEGAARTPAGAITPPKASFPLDPIL